MHVSKGAERSLSDVEAHNTLTQQDHAVVLWH